MAVCYEGNASANPKAAMTTFTKVWGRTARIWDCGNFICIKLPLNALRICWKTQLLLIRLPIQCSYTVFCLIRQSMIRLLLGRKQESSINVLKDFIGCDLHDNKKLLKTVHDLRASSLLAITRMNDLNRKFAKYRKHMVGWKAATDRHNQQLANIANEEKKLILVIIAALKNLKQLKNSKDAIDEKFARAVEDLSTFSKNISASDFDLIKNLPAAEISAALKSSYNGLHKQTEQMRCILENKRTSHSCSSPIDNENLSPKNHQRSLNGWIENECHANMNLLNMSMGAFDTIVSLLRAENIELKKRLKTTSGHLEDMNNTSSCLNRKVTSLEQQLDEVKELLQSVEADRDNMRGKLITLEGMIEEEEVFLNDDFSCDDSYNELYITTKEFQFSDLECSSPMDSFGKIEHMELEWNSPESDEDIKELKSLELSLSR